MNHPIKLSVLQLLVIFKAIFSFLAYTSLDIICKTVILCVVPIFSTMISKWNVIKYEINIAIFNVALDLMNNKLVCQSNY